MRWYRLALGGRTGRWRHKPPNLTLEIILVGKKGPLGIYRIKRLWFLFFRNVFKHFSGCVPQDTSTDAIVEIGRHQGQRQEDDRPQDLKLVLFSDFQLLFFFLIEMWVDSPISFSCRICRQVSGFPGRFVQSNHVEARHCHSAPEELGFNLLQSSTIAFSFFY